MGMRLVLGIPVPCWPALEAAELPPAAVVVAALLEEVEGGGEELVFGLGGLPVVAIAPTPPDSGETTIPLDDFPDPGVALLRRSTGVTLL